MARRSFVVVAALLLAVGCSADQKGAAPPPPVTSTAAATPASTPTPVASPTPFVSTADEAGAFAFARQYIAVLEQAFATGDITPLQPLRRATCKCVDFEQRIRTSYESGGRIEGVHYRIVDVLAGQQGPSFSKVTVSFESTPDVTIRRDGSRESGSGARGDYYLSLVREGDHWIIDSFDGNARPYQP